MADAPRHPGLPLGAARFYYDPRGSIRGVLDSRPSEGRLLAYLLVAMAIIAVGRLARLSLAYPPGSQEFIDRAIPEVVSWLFVVPLFYYLLAGLFSAVCRMFSTDGSWRDGRAAFFWAALVAAPVVVLSAVAAPALAPHVPNAVAVAVGQLGPVFFAWALSQTFAEAFGLTRSWLVLAAICAPFLILLAISRLAS